MPALTRDARFSGSATNGEFTAPPGFDAVINVGDGSEIYQIERIIASYELPLVSDYQGVAIALRSFTGRLLILETKLQESLTPQPTVAPNTALTSALPPPYDQQRLLFDCFVHSFDKPHQFDFTGVGDLGALQCNPGSILSVVLIAGNVFGAASPNAQYLHFQHLHVEAKRLSQNPTLRLGNYEAEG